MLKKQTVKIDVQPSILPTDPYTFLLILVENFIVTRQGSIYDIVDEIFHSRKLYAWQYTDSVRRC